MGRAGMASELRAQLELDMGPPPSDEALMRALQDGARSALGVLVERHGATAVNYAWRLTGELASAQDVAQEAFLGVYARREAFDSGQRFLVWLYRIVGDLCRAVWRRRGGAAVTPAADGASEAAAEPGPTATEDGGREAVEEQVRRAVVGLPEGLRVVFVLSFYEGLSYEAIAEVLGCSVRTVWSRKRLAVRRLEENLGAAGAASWGGS